MSCSCVKGARVGDFQGKNLSTGFNSIVLYNDDKVPEVAGLRQWWASTGSTAATKSLSSSGGAGRVAKFEDRKGLASIKHENLGYKEKPDWIDTKAIIAFIKHDGTYCYPACPEEGNNKKVIEESDGTWRCEANGKTYDAPEWRYILSLCINDYTGNTWVTAFNDEAVEIMNGVTAGELKELQASGNEAEFERKFQEALFSEKVLTLRAMADTYKDEMRVRVTIRRAANVDYVQESRNIINFLQAYK